MKIKISKKQWEEIGQKTGWIKIAETINAKTLYYRFLQEGKNPKQAAEELLDILTNGAFAAFEEPGRTQMINKVIAKFPQPKSERQNISRKTSWNKKAQVNPYEEAIVPCKICKEKTKMTGTGLCDRCWMVMNYLENPVSGSDKQYMYNLTKESHPEIIELVKQELIKQNPIINK